jgi:hypothetical protein
MINEVIHMLLTYLQYIQKGFIGKFKVVASIPSTPSLSDRGTWNRKINIKFIPNIN